MKTILPILVVTLLCGCASNITSSGQSAAGTDITYDPYLGGYTVRGKVVDLGGFPNVTKVCLRGGFDKHGQNEFYQLYVLHWSQTGWYFLHSASDANAVFLPLRKLDQSVSIGATVQEQVAIDLTRDYLSSHQTSGMDIRVLGSKGSLIVKLNALYIQGFLQKFDGFKANPTGSHPPKESYFPSTVTKSGGLLERNKIETK